MPPLGMVDTDVLTAVRAIFNILNMGKFISLVSVGWLIGWLVGLVWLIN